tara:strand:+ start:634 stop:1203 length:570 start_codon:yes stop_codon:yes gene_type:complete
MSKYTAFKNYVDYVEPVVDTIREHHNEFYELRYSLINAEDIFVESVADRLLGFRQGIYEPSSAGYIPCIYARYGEESGATVALQLTPVQYALLTNKVSTAMFGKNSRWKKAHDIERVDVLYGDNRIVYVIMEHQYFQTVSGFHTRITTNLLHTPLDYVTEKLGLSYLDSERDPYLFDICFESALESNQV